MTTRQRRRTRRLSEPAYEAALEALACFYWYKKDLKNFLRAELREAPAILAKLDFDATKRQVAADLVAELRLLEEKYQDLTIELLVRLSEFDERFSHLARLPDGPLLVPLAQAALKSVQDVVRHHRDHVENLERLREHLVEQAEEAQRRRDHAAVLEQLRQRFFELMKMPNPQQRGRDLEKLLNELFGLFDLYPRAAYTIAHEQIDGAFTFDNDDYLLEAKWHSAALQPHHLDVLKGKIERKAKNVLALFVSITGFTAGAIAAHSSGTPMILMDGSDLIAVLEGRISLPEVLLRKRRHASETGSPMLSVRDMLL